MKMFTTAWFRLYINLKFIQISNSHCVSEVETAFLSPENKTIKKLLELQMRHQPKYNKYAVAFLLIVK